MKRVLFVDDEVKVLDGLRRMLRKLRREWEMQFAPGGPQALELLESWPCDVVVSDMRMPGMDGAQLLQEVMQRHPSTVRIILSGQCHRQAVLKAVGPAHLFLTKPCDSETLKTTISRACRLRDQLGEESLRRTVSCVGPLPSLPEVFGDLEEELSRESPSSAAIGRLVDADVAISARLLQLVSSSFFGSPRQVSSAAEAADLLGSEILRGLFGHSEVLCPVAVGSEEHRVLERVVEHSRAVALAAQAIARAETDDAAVAADAFLAGWLHEMGCLVLLAAHRQRYAEMFACSQAEGTCLAEAEQAAFGTSQAAAGAYLLGLWGVRDPIVRAVGLHLAPQQQAAPDQQTADGASDMASGTDGAAPGRGFEPLTALHAAHSLVTQEQPCCGPPTEIDEDYLQQVGCADRLPQWRELCQGVVAEGAIT